MDRRPEQGALHPYLDTPTPHAFAHRGGAAGGPENSMTAFEQAVAMGYRYLETDVRMTRDGVLVAFHDPGLGRVTDRRGRIAELDWAEVGRARIAGVEPVARLDEVLGAWDHVRFNLDVKEDAAVPALARKLRDHNILDRVAVGSFSDDRLAALRQEFGARLCTSAGPTEVRRLRLGSYVRAPSILAPVGADCVQIPPRRGWVPLADERFIDYCHRRGLLVHVWTIDSPVVIHELLERGVDGVMTDDIAALKGVLMAREQWRGEPEGRGAPTPVRGP